MLKRCSHIINNATPGQTGEQCVCLQPCVIDPDVCACSECVYSRKLEYTAHVGAVVVPVNKSKRLLVCVCVSCVCSVENLV